jgi:hypothetical protein
MDILALQVYPIRIRLRKIFSGKKPAISNLIRISHIVPVIAILAAASNTPLFAITSFREQSHVARTFKSSLLRRMSLPRSW